MASAAWRNPSGSLGCTSLGHARPIGEVRDRHHRVGIVLRRQEHLRVSALLLVASLLTKRRPCDINPSLHENRCAYPVRLGRIQPALALRLAGQFPGAAPPMQPDIVGRLSIILSCLLRYRSCFRLFGGPSVFRRRAALLDRGH